MTKKTYQVTMQRIETYVINVRAESADWADEIVGNMNDSSLGNPEAIDYETVSVVELKA